MNATDLKNPAAKQRYYVQVSPTQWIKVDADFASQAAALARLEGYTVQTVRLIDRNA
jgi:hypothetical protein